jgi:OmpA family
MNRHGLILSLLIAAVTAALLGGGHAGADQGAGVIVHFDSGRAVLNDAAKAVLKKLFQTYAAGPHSRIFVVGYTDGRGAKTFNAKLSRQRAEAVRREIVAACGIDPAIVTAQGKGVESPLAGNGSTAGRSLNRRAEVYLVNGRERQPPREYGPGDPLRPEIQNLVHEAQGLIKQRRLDGAFQQLNKARALGGDHYSDWQAAYGIAGYYAGVPLEQSHAHLASALNLDPYDFKAREFIGRVDARQKVAHGEVTREMGRTMEAAIPITTAAQQYEYLRLFEVEPLTHEALENQPVDRWHCIDRQGSPVQYYFNHALAYQWALASSAPARKPEPMAVTPPSGGDDAPARGQDHPKASAGLAKVQRSDRIWKSRIFK